MTDHTPSPATDGLREAIEALADQWQENARKNERAGQFPWAMWQNRANELTALLAAHPALLADPAPEAANIEDLIERSSLGTPEAKALRATVSDEDAARIVARSKGGAL